MLLLLWVNLKKLDYKNGNNLEFKGQWLALKDHTNTSNLQESLKTKAERWDMFLQKSLQVGLKN